MPWARDVNSGQHVHYNLARPVIRNVTPQTIVASADIQTSTTGLQEGTFVQFSGTESPQQHAQAAAQKNYSSPTLSVEMAEPSTNCVAGVVVGANQVKSTGTVLAWVIQQKRELPLSGVYATSINGVHVANTAIVQMGKAIVLARSKDDDVERLKQQFSQLTNS